MIEKMMDGPVPGQSLVGEPKKYPWERPPEINEPRAAIDYHLENLMDEDKLEASLMILESGIFTIEGLTTFILRKAVAEGIHSIDISLGIAPVIHEFLKKSAEAAGVNYKENLGKRKMTDKDREEMANALSQLSVLSEEEIPEEEPSVEMEEPPVEEEKVDLSAVEEPKGLMSRGRV